ncbi:MAG: 3-phenylpropionate MFS transporter [Rhodospirillaceae bacterium]|nr:3-phenylpropionate MFS transporter [Rhodospirillaceae bacterium]
MTAVRLATYYGVIFLVIGVMLPFWPLWMSSRGLGPEEIGVVMAVGMMMKVFANPLVAGFADRTGERKRPLIALSIIAGAAFSMFYGAQGFWPVLLVTMAFFFFWSPLMPIIETLTMQLGRNQDLDYGRIRLWGSLTFIIGAWGMGWLLTGRDIDLVYWATFGGTLAVAAAAFFLPDVNAAAPSNEKSPEVQTLILTVLKDRTFLVFIAAAGLIQTSHIIYYAFGTIHWQKSGLSEFVIGALWAEGVVAEILLFIWGEKLIRRFGAARLIALAGLAGLIRWGFTGMTDDLGALVVLQALHGLTFGAAHLGAIHFIARRMDPAIAATAQSVYAAAVMGLGFGLASSFSGHLYATQGAAAYFPMAIMAGAGGVLAYMLRRPPDENGQDRYLGSGA